MNTRKQISKEYTGSYGKDNTDESVLCSIHSAIREIRYGSIQIHIQDGKVVQIDKINKVRMR